MDINVLKFGGSSVANNENLQIVAHKIIDFKKDGKGVVAVVSAQGKTTDKLVGEAEELEKISTNNNLKKLILRERDALISVGEQISAAKLAILLNSMGQKAISLNRNQAGILTNSDFGNAKIKRINTKRILKEIDSGKIVIITGFQGVDSKNNITTLGRGGSDTSAVAIAVALGAKECYIFSDVDGIYTSDPNKVKNAKKLSDLTYKEMQLTSSAGAKVLHDRCVELAEKYNVKIVANSTFNRDDKNQGTIIKKDALESHSVKTITKTEVSKITIVGAGISNEPTILSKIDKVLEEYSTNIMSIELGAYQIIIVFNKIMSDEILSKLHEKLITNL